MVGENIHTIRKKAETVSEASKEIGPEGNTEKNKYFVMSRYKNAKKATIYWLLIIFLRKLHSSSKGERL
jgi:hypothetical protein